jgi:hypothetical protein
MYWFEPGTSFSTVYGYGLDDWAIEVRSPAQEKDFSSNLCVQTGSGAHPASCTMGTGFPFPGGKARPGCDADHSRHLVQRSRMSRSYTSSPPSAFVACSGTSVYWHLLSTQVYSLPWKQIVGKCKTILMSLCKISNYVSLYFLKYSSHWNTFEIKY